MKTVLAPGVYDCLHIGHLRHLQAAKTLGDCLVVSVTPDRYVDKGPGRPPFSTEERADMVRALHIVDEVHVENAFKGGDIIKLVRPDIYVCGIEYRYRMPQTVTSLCFQMNIEIRFLETRGNWSTTKIITGEALSERIDAVRKVG